MAKLHAAPTPLPATASTQTVSRDEAEVAYQRGDLLLKRAYVMERWAQFCTDPLTAIARHDQTHGATGVGWLSTRWQWHIRRIPLRACSDSEWET